MAAYVIAEIEVTDPEGYEEYRRLAAATIEKHAGRYLVRGGAAELLEEGDAPQRLVVVQFPSAAQARTWFESPEYREARAIRRRTARSRLVLAEGI